MNPEHQVVHDGLKLAVRNCQRSEFKLATLLWTLHSKRLYLERGYSSTAHYAEVELDLGWRKVKDLLAIGKRLPELPHLAEKFSEGRLSYTKAREVIRVADPATEAAWTERALWATSREVEDLVAASAPGNAPPTAAEMRLKPARVRLVWQTDATHAELIRRALRSLRQEAELCEQTDDGALIAELCRRYLESPPPGVPVSAERYRIVIHHCPACQRTHLGHAGAPAGHEACCGETHVGPSEHGDSGQGVARDKAHVGPSKHHDSGPNVAGDETHLGPVGENEPADVGSHGPPSPGATRIDPQTIHRGVPTDLYEVSEWVRGEAACDAEIVDLTRPQKRLTRQVAPVTRRTVLERDGYRCSVPHCRAWLWLDVHHYEPRSLGGSNDASNLLVLCPQHHHLVHRQILILARTDDGIRCFHADGTPFGPSHDVDAPEIERPAVAEAILQLLDAGPRYDVALEQALDLPHGRVRRLLSMLRAQAEVVQIATGEWVRVDRLVPTAPTWVGRDAGVVS